MGRKKTNAVYKPAGQKTLPVTVDEHGNVAFDAIVKQNENASKIVYSQHKDLVPKILKDAMEEEEEEEEKTIEETTMQTVTELEKIVNRKLSSTARPKKNVPTPSTSKFIKYKPSRQCAAFNSGAKERIIRMVEMPVDPLEPPKFKHKKVPKPSGSPPVPVMHSPPRPVTIKDQQDWKIPPCISNWKNTNRYTIPLDKRLVADGRGLQEVKINDNFAKLSEALYVAEQMAREGVETRSKVLKEVMMKEKEMKEEELRALARKARSDHMRGEKEKDVIPSEYSREEREKIREERQRERKRERRLEAKDVAGGKKKKSKITRDRERDVSEKVALGMASCSSGQGRRGGEVMYDQRLFNQEKGMDSGFATDDRYNVYDKGLFTAGPTLSTLYRPNKKDADDDDDEDVVDKIMKTERFKPDKAFAGTLKLKTGPRERPVEFEKEEDDDPFGLDQFLREVKKGEKGT